MHDKIKKFFDSSTAHDFVELFKPFEYDDDDNKVFIEEPSDLSMKEGFRLFRHFRQNCHQYDIAKFLTYLTTDQYNTLMIYLVRIKT